VDLHHRPRARFVRPTVTLTVPADEATGVDSDSNVTATFSEIMSASTIDLASFTVQRLGVSIAASVSYDGLTATLNPDVALEFNTPYTGNHQRHRRRSLGQHACRGSHVDFHHWPRA
jgi:hypothetical protein